MPGQIDQNLAKLQRNMASCYLHLKEVDKVCLFMYLFALLLYL